VRKLGPGTAHRGPLLNSSPEQCAVLVRLCLSLAEVRSEPSEHENHGREARVLPSASVGLSGSS